jgi:hypothetical protein
MNKDATQSWLKLLNPTELKQNLIRCSIFITAWELLKEAIVDPILWHYTDGFIEKKYLRPRYHKEVIELDTREKKDPVNASCLWLRKNNVIDDIDLQMIFDFRDHRNVVAHEMIKVLASTEVQVNLGLLDNLIIILGKIDKWWISEVELPTNPDFTEEDFRNIDYDNILSMRMMVLQLISTVAYDDDQSLTALYEEFKKRL